MPQSSLDVTELEKRLEFDDMIIATTDAIDCMDPGGSQYDPACRYQ